MLRFMACCVLFALVLGGYGLVWPALIAAGLFFATPVVALAWYALGPAQTLDG